LKIIECEIAFGMGKLPSQPAIHHVSKRLRADTELGCSKVINTASRSLVKKFKTVRPNLDAACVNRDGPSASGTGLRRRNRISSGRAAILLFLPSALLIAFPGAAHAATPPPATEALQRLRDQDALLAALAWRLTTANAALCDQLMPGTGVVLHARNQYPDALAAPAEALFGFAGPLAIETIVPGSPAALGGLLANDGVLAAGSLEPTAADGDARPDTLVRDRFEDRLVALPPAVPLTWRVLRGGVVRDVLVTPQPACRARFEIVPGTSLTARNTGQLVQLSARYFERLSPDELAVVIAHELAHSVLGHRRRLVAAGVSKGLLAEFGRNGRLNRQVEREADRLSVHLLRNAGYDPALAPWFWKAHGKELGGGLLRSRVHDSPAARVRLLRAEIAAIPAEAALPYLPPLLALRDQPLK
jgi:hypothetical protein